MNSVLLVTLTILVALAGAFAVPYLSNEQLLGFIFVAILVCVVCGWISTFQIGGVRKSKGLKEYIIYGGVAPVYKNWLKPLKISTNIYILLFSASLIIGVIVRIFILIH